MEKNKEITKKQKHFILGVMVICALLFVRDYGALVNSYNSTLFALSYQYGFISRGLSGTIYAILNAVLPIDIMTYAWVLRFVFALTMLFYALLFAFFVFLMKKASCNHEECMRWLIVFYAIFAVTFFACEHNFGRVDIYMTAITIICLMLLVSEKREWLVIPLSAIAVMFHQGYVFMYFNVTLILLLYKMLTKKEKRRKYLILFISSFLVGSIFFLYFEFFSHSNGQEFYEEVVQIATSISEPSEGYHEGLLQHEILGTDLTESETEYHLRNFVEFPIFLVFMSPFIVFLIRFFKGLIGVSQSKWEKRKYILTAIGPLTIVPNLILKCDYGRWVFAVLTYYCLVIMGMLAMKDHKVEEQLTSRMASIKQNPWKLAMLILPLLICPLWDVNISRVAAHLGGDLNKWFFHLWVD